MGPGLSSRLFSTAVHSFAQSFCEKLIDAIKREVYLSPNLFGSSEDGTKVADL
jgi:hypothetical protein